MGFPLFFEKEEFEVVVIRALAHWFLVSRSLQIARMIRDFGEVKSADSSSCSTT